MRHKNQELFSTWSKKNNLCEGMKGLLLFGGFWCSRISHDLLTISLSDLKVERSTSSFETLTESNSLHFKEPTIGMFRLSLILRAS